MDKLKGHEAIVIIGDKPKINYIHSLGIQFFQNNQEQVIIKGYGKFMGRAVEVAHEFSTKFVNKTIGIKQIESDPKKIGLIITMIKMRN